MLVLLYSAGLTLYTMKADHSILTAEWSALTCTIPIFFGLGICCFWNAGNGCNFGTLVGSVCLALLPMTLITMFIVQQDDGYNIELWVYFMIVFVFMCCGFCNVFALIVNSGFGSS